MNDNFTKEQKEFLKTTKTGDKVEIGMGVGFIREIFLFEKDGDIFCLPENKTRMAGEVYINRWEPDKWRPILPKQYRPYTVDDWQIFLSKPVKTKCKIKHGYSILKFDEREIQLSKLGKRVYTYQEMYELLEHIDGTPCGVEISIKENKI